VYCRPVCRAAAPANPTFYASAAAAQRTGRLPCSRCQADAAPSVPEWVVANPTLVRSLRLLQSGFLNHHSGTELAARVALDAATLQQQFEQTFGCSPEAMASLQRAYIARVLLTRSGLALAPVAYHAGYRNVAQLRRQMLRTYALSATELRHSSWAHHATATTARAAGSRPSKTAVTLSLPLRLPYHFDWMFGYLQRRALPGVEEVSGGPRNWCYRRLLNTTTVQSPAWLQVQVDEAVGLRVTLPLLDGHPVYSLLYRLGRVFDVSADGSQVHKFLRSQPDLAIWAKQAPGLRVAGAWDGYETAIRAVLGQQVSVERGTVLANKMINQYGGGVFPGPALVKDRQVAELGMPGRRGRAVAKLAELVHNGSLVVDETQDYDELQRTLQDIEGIGPWTANYVRMRVLKDVDAFPDNDWVVLKQLQCSAAQARRQAQAWRPWRAYALMYLWYASAQTKAT